MAEEQKPASVPTNVVRCEKRDGQWFVTHEFTNLPLTGRDLATLARTLKQRQRLDLRQYQLKLKAQKTLTVPKKG